MSTASMEPHRLDDAARAGWLYYVAGKTQDDIARAMNISRQRAQRLVAQAVTEGLIKVRLEHPVARCMELAQALQQRFGLLQCEVVPSVNDDPNSTLGLGEAGARAIEKALRSDEPKTIAFGTGRVLRACADELMQLDCPQHNIVSLVGNISSQGTATRFDVAVRIAERINGQHYPMPLPVITDSPDQREALHALPHIKRILTLGRQADATFVGIGSLGVSSPLHKDGFASKEDLLRLSQAGAVGEIISWIYNGEGTLIDAPLAACVTSAPLQIAPHNPVTGIAAGENKLTAMMGALRSRLINGLITNEYTAQRILETA